LVFHVFSIGIKITALQQKTTRIEVVFYDCLLITLGVLSLLSNFATFFYLNARTAPFFF